MHRPKRQRLLLRRTFYGWKKVPFTELTFVLKSRDNSESRERAKNAVYVKPSIDIRGRFRKGYLRMPVSTKKNAIKNQNRSRYSYDTKGKYRKKKN